MGEDTPVDPSQMQPKQDGEARHIEITSDEDDSQIGEIALSNSIDSAEHIDDNHEDLRSLGVEIYNGVQDLLDAAEDFKGKSPHGWELGHDAPNYVSAEFKQNAKLHELDGWQNPKTELFTKQLRIQETNVVAPYEEIEGGGVRLTLLEIPEEPVTNGTLFGKTIITDTTRLDIMLYPDGRINYNSYIQGDSRDRDGTIEGPGTFGHGNHTVVSKPLQFGEQDAQHLLQIIDEIRSDAHPSKEVQSSSPSSEAEIKSDAKDEKLDEAHARYIERLESWTTTLADSPPSEAFKQRFGMEIINARMLTNIERSMVTTMADDSATEVMVQTAQLQKTFLEDIRTGRAANWE